MTCWEGCCTHKARVAICLFIILIAFVLHVIGFSTPYWYYQSKGNVEIYGGLWKNCSEVNNVASCVDLIDTETEAWEKANQGLQTIGMILLLVAVICVMVVVICCQPSSAVRIVAIAMLLGAATFIIIGVIVFAAESPDFVTDNLHFAFAFVVSAAGLAVIGAICLCIGISDNWTTEELE